MMKKTKRILALTLTAWSLLALTACSGQKASETATTENRRQEKQQQQRKLRQQRVREKEKNWLFPRIWLMRRRWR